MRSNCRAAPPADALRAMASHVAATKARGAAVLLFQVVEVEIEMARQSRSRAAEICLQVQQRGRMAVVLVMMMREIVERKCGERLRGRCRCPRETQSHRE